MQVFLRKYTHKIGASRKRRGSVTRVKAVRNRWCSPSFKRNVSGKFSVENDKSGTLKVLSVGMTAKDNVSADTGGSLAAGGRCKPPP